MEEVQAANYADKRTRNKVAFIEEQVATLKLELLQEVKGSK